MANENNFKETVNSLFKGMDSFISAKTVVGRSGAAAGGQGSGGSHSTTNGQERTASDLFHHVFLRFSQYKYFPNSGHFFRPGSLIVFSLGTP